MYQCQGDDNWIALTARDEYQWQKFCQAIGNPSLTSKTEFSTLEQRKKNEDALDKLITEWTLMHTADEIEVILRKEGIPCNIVEKASDIYKDPQLASRNYFTSLEHPVMGMQKYEAQGCFILSKTPREIKTPSPTVGEHNEYVFKELLKMSDDEIAEFIIDGSITSEFVGRMTSSF